MKKKEPAGGKKPADEKKKEQKIVYIDDGSTVADMDGTYPRGKPRQRSTFKEKFKTYITVVKNLLPYLLITLLAFTLVYLVVLAIAGKLW